MVIHPTKSQFLAVNGKDISTIQVNDVKIGYAESYTYLGTIIENKTCANQVRSHIRAKGCQILKFSSFLVKNADAPYSVKELVWESALKSSILYGCETWLTSDLRAVEKPYMGSLKQLLGVRQSTCNDIALAEVGLADIKAQIRDKQMTYLKKLLERTDFRGSYIDFAINLAITCQSSMGLCIQSLKDDIYQRTDSAASVSKSNIRARIRESNSTRRITYCEINPDLTVSPIYSPTCEVPEHARVATTRLRLSSHRLRVETGRWSRIPREERKCDCGQVQSEEHVLLFCPRSAALRSNFPVVSQVGSITQFFSGINQTNVKEICVFCDSTLKLFN
jgi:hypothetical protein